MPIEMINPFAPKPEVSPFAAPSLVPPYPAQLGFDANQFPSWQEGQKELIEKVVRWYGSSKKFLFVEAPPGWGKSLVAAGVLATLVKHHREFKGLVTTTTVNLQNQYMETMKDLGRTVSGRGNYPCIVVPEVTVAQGPCLSRWPCPEKHRCAYFTARDDAQSYNISVLNTSYFLTASEYARIPGVDDDTPEEERYLFRDRDLVIHDECHLLEQQIQSLISAELSIRFFADIGITIPRSHQYGDWVEFIIQHRPTVQALARAYHAEARKLATQGQAPNDPQGRRAVAAYNALHRIETELLPNRPLIEFTDKAARFRPVWGREFAQHYLFNKAPKHMLMSATIPHPEYLAYTLGIEPEDYLFIRLPSKFHPRRRAIVVDPVVKVSRKTSDAEHQVLVDRMDHYIDQYPEQRGIVHTVSFARAQLIKRQSRHSGRMILHEQGKGMKELAIDRYLATEAAILLSPSVGVGEDFGKGDNCRFQIIAKWPLPNFGDPVVKARAQDDKDAAWKESDMAFIQAVGRGTRSEDDYCTTYLLDQQGVWRLKGLPDYIKESLVS